MYMMSWAPSAFSLKTPKKGGYCTTQTHVITLCDDRPTWTDRNSLTGIGRQWIFEVFLHKLHLKCIKMFKEWLLMIIITLHHLVFFFFFLVIVWFRRWLFWTLVFFWGPMLPQKNTSVPNNHLLIHSMTSNKIVCSYYCLNNISALKYA